MPVSLLSEHQTESLYCVQKALGNDKVPLSREERRKLAIFNDDDSDSSTKPRRRAGSSSTGTKRKPSAQNVHQRGLPQMKALEGRRDRRTIEEVEWDMKQRRAQVAAQSQSAAGTSASASNPLSKMASFKTGSSASAPKTSSASQPSSSTKAASQTTASSAPVKPAGPSKKPSVHASEASVKPKPASDVPPAKRKRDASRENPEEEDHRRRRPPPKATTTKSSNSRNGNDHIPREHEIDRDYIWSIMGRRPPPRVPDSDDEDFDSGDDDDMEAGIDEVLAEEQEAEAWAAKEERIEAARLKKHAEEKKKRLGK